MKNKNLKYNKKEKNETITNDKYNQMLLTMEEEDILMEEIEKFIIKNNSQENLEELVKIKYLTQIEEKRLKTQKAIKEWKESISKEIKTVQELFNEDLGNLDDFNFDDFNNKK